MTSKLLTEQQLQLISPEITRLQQIEQEKQVEWNRLQRMLMLIEPDFADKDLGVIFDMKQMAFTYPDPELTGDGIAAEAALTTDGE